MKNNVNTEISNIFERIANILEFKGENIFRVVAYRKAARSIRELTSPLSKIMEEERLTEIAGVGKDLATYIEEYIKKGKIVLYEQLKQEVSEELIDLSNIQGLGPKTLRKLYNAYNIGNLQDLKELIKDKEELPEVGLRKKSLENLRQGIELYEQGLKRFLLGVALPIAENLCEKVRKLPTTSQVELAGSSRRRKETVGDLDILCVAENGTRVIDAFTRFDEVKIILAKGSTKGSVILENNLQVDLRVIEKKSYGAALQYFTGSKAHNVHLRRIAKQREIKINEYGVFRGEKRIGGEDEKDIYQALDMVWIPPVLREDRGEIEKATEKKLPKLVSISDIKGDLHVHSKWSDGVLSIEEVVQEAIRRKYEYIAITDHSPSSRIANGLSIERLYDKLEEIDKLRQKFRGKINILSGSEVDIKNDGSLDYPDDVLKDLDIVLVAIHTGFKQDESKITGRIVDALSNRYVHILVHPTGRMIGVREPYKVNMEKIFETAKKHNKCLEINAQIMRLDLNDIYVKEAIRRGIKLSIATDTHHPENFDYMKFGIYTAQRGWVEAKDVINTYPLPKLTMFLEKACG
ncbi:MAG: DNA polymerase/3'-5' exonuclease PolX [Deltaproteobacteria bacterium]|nr:DNA polymerase/3'-5' exonuclease PolX [Deltaproteobacteria bacterium]